MINKVKLTKIKDNITALFKMFGTAKDIKAEYITPYGYYANPINKRAITIDNNRYILALHNSENLPFKLNGNNDICITDNKSYLHISYSNNKIEQFSKNEIEITTKTLVCNNDNYIINTADTMVINAKKLIINATTSIEFSSPTITHNGKNIGDTHVHVAVAIGSNTTPPI